jgi:hypothetical protein
MTFRKKAGEYYGKKPGSKSNKPHYDHVPSSIFSPQTGNGKHDDKPGASEESEVHGWQLFSSKLRDSIWQGNLAEFERLMPELKTPDTQLHNKQTPLLLALSRLEVLRRERLSGTKSDVALEEKIESMVHSLLFNHGANPNTDNEMGLLPLAVAFSCGRRVTEWLLEAGADPDNVSSGNGLSPRQSLGSAIVKLSQIMEDNSKTREQRFFARNMEEMLSNARSACVRNDERLRGLTAGLQLGPQNVQARPLRQIIPPAAPR